jgi:hypothetical protein
MRSVPAAGGLFRNTAKELRSSVEKLVKLIGNDPRYRRVVLTSLLPGTLGTCFANSISRLKLLAQIQPFRTQKRTRAGAFVPEDYICVISMLMMHAK